MSYLPCLDEDWVIESIPDENYLYCRVSDNHVINGELISAALREDGVGEKRGKSANWDKYSDPQNCIDEARNKEKKYYVLKFLAKDIRSIPKQKITHAPVQDRDLNYCNRSHSNINGLDQKDNKEKTKIRAQYLQIYIWCNEYKP